MMGEKAPRQLSLKDLKLAQLFGGADTEDYESPDNLNYCDKGQHLLSSLFHQPNHAEHWKKEEKKQTHS